MGPPLIKPAKEGALFQGITTMINRDFGENVIDFVDFWW